jgi:hypothetical protein
MAMLKLGVNNILSSQKPTIHVKDNNIEYPIVANSVSTVINAQTNAKNIYNEQETVTKKIVD